MPEIEQLDLKSFNEMIIAKHSMVTNGWAVKETVTPFIKYDNDNEIEDNKSESDSEDDQPNIPSIPVDTNAPYIYGRPYSETNLGPIINLDDIKEFINYKDPKGPNFRLQAKVFFMVYDMIISKDDIVETSKKHGILKIDSLYVSHNHGNTYVYMYIEKLNTKSGKMDKIDITSTDAFKYKSCIPARYTIKDSKYQPVIAWVDKADPMHKPVDENKKPSCAEQAKDWTKPEDVYNSLTNWCHAPAALNYLAAKQEKADEDENIALKYWKGYSPWGWHFDLLNQTMNSGEQRDIFWYWSKRGKTGKSTIGMYLMANYPESFHMITDPAKLSDVSTNMKNAKKSGWKGHVMIINLTMRYSGNNTIYTILENIKDAVTTVAKNESQTTLRNFCTVIVLANFPPNFYKKNGSPRLDPTRVHHVEVPHADDYKDIEDPNDPIPRIRLPHADLLPQPTEAEKVMLADMEVNRRTGAPPPTKNEIIVNQCGIPMGEVPTKYVAPEVNKNINLFPPKVVPASPSKKVYSPFNDPTHRLYIKPGTPLASNSHVNIVKIQTSEIVSTPIHIPINEQTFIDENKLECEQNNNDDCDTNYASQSLKALKPKKYNLTDKDDNYDNDDNDCNTNYALQSVKSNSGYRKPIKHRDGLKWAKYLNREDTNETKGTKYSQALLVYNHITPTSVIICKQEEYRSFHMFKDVSDLYNKHYSNMPPEEKTYYEVITACRPRKLYFDLDIPSDKYSEEDAYTLLKQIISGIKIVESRITDTDIMIFNSHGPSKFSFHVIIDRFIIDSHTEGYAFCELVSDHVEERFKSIIDLSVYKSVQQLRIYESQKYKSDRPKIVDREDKWTYPTQHEDSPKIQNRFRFQSSLVTFTLGNNTALKLECKEKKVYKGEGRVYSSDECKKMEKLLNVAYPKTFKYSNSQDSSIYFKRVKPNMCSICNRKHESNNVSVFINKTGEVRMCCYANVGGSESQLLGTM